jgi:hypothetical protein
MGYRIFGKGWRGYELAKVGYGNGGSECGYPSSSYPGCSLARFARQPMGSRLQVDRRIRMFTQIGVWGVYGLYLTLAGLGIGYVINEILDWLDDRKDE